jgi:hypothetical protein
LTAVVYIRSILRLLSFNTQLQLLLASSAASLLISRRFNHSCSRGSWALLFQPGTSMIGHFHILDESIAGGKTLTPRQAIAIAAIGLPAGAAVVGLACMLFLVPFWEAMTYYGIGGYFVLVFPWACLDRESVRRVIRAHNRLVYFFVAVLLVTLILQWGTDGKPFPKWAVGSLIGGAVASYSVMGYYATRNFRRWRRGDFRVQGTNN